MPALQLACNRIVTGCGLGLVAVSVSFIYATTKIFHVVHAGTDTMDGYIACLCCGTAYESSYLDSYENMPSHDG